MLALRIRSPLGRQTTLYHREAAGRKLRFLGSTGEFDDDLWLYVAPVSPPRTPEPLPTTFEIFDFFSTFGTSAYPILSGSYPTRPAFAYLL